MKQRRFLAASVVGLALVATACGSDKSDKPASSATAAESATAASGTAASSMAESSMSETMAESKDEGKAEGSGAEGDCASPDVFCVGLVTDLGKVDDKSFNQAAWAGVEASGADQTKYIETTDSKDYANNIAQFTDAGYDVIVTVGFLMADATTAAAGNYPDTKFIGVDQFQAADVANLTGLTFPEDQAGYAAGFLAGKLTKSNQIGQVLGMQIPPVEKFAKGYEAGAAAANPDVKVTTVYHPAGDTAFADPVWGSSEAKKQLDQGADIIFGAGGSTGNGALGEVAKAEGAGSKVFCIGVDQDQWETVPEAHPCLVTSAMKNISQGVQDLLGQAKDGSIKGGNFVGTTGLAPYHDLESAVPADVQKEVADVVAGLTDGSITTGVTVGG